MSSLIEAIKSINVSKKKSSLVAFFCLRQVFPKDTRKSEPTADMKNFGKHPSIHKKQGNREMISGVFSCVGVSVQISRSSLGKLPSDIGSHWSEEQKRKTGPKIKDYFMIFSSILSSPKGSSKKKKTCRE